MNAADKGAACGAGGESARPSALGHRSRGAAPERLVPFRDKERMPGQKKRQIRESVRCDTTALLSEQLARASCAGRSAASVPLPPARGLCLCPPLGRSMLCRGGETLKCRIRGPRAPRSARLAPFVLAASSHLRAFSSYVTQIPGISRWARGRRGGEGSSQLGTLSGLKNFSDHHASARAGGGSHWCCRAALPIQSFPGWHRCLARCAPPGGI